METTDIGLDFVEHHGVKGMRWGVRRQRLQATSEVSKRTTAGREQVRSVLQGRRSETESFRQAGRAPAPVRATPSIGRSSFTKSKVKTVGGEDHPPHEDAVKVAVARQKMKKSGIVALSNAELQQMSQRMQLESQVHSLNARRPKSIGQGFVDAHLAKLQKDPIGTIEKAHKFHKRAVTAAKIAAVVA
jgi:hypothetical protein